MKRLMKALSAATVLAAVPAAAQTDIAYTAAETLQLPPFEYFGEVAGVASNSKGAVFVFTRTGDPSVSLGGSRTFQRGGTRLFEFDAGGKYVRELGKGVYGFLVAQQIRVDAQDNIWAVDASSGMVMKFNPAGTKILMLLGRKPESIDVPQPPRSSRATPQGAGAQADLFDYPTDVAFDAAGNIFVADGLGANTRVAKFDRNGKFIKTFGVKGTGDGQFADTHSVQVDGSGNVYVADQGNRRIQVFDNDGNFKSQIAGIGAPAALCISKSGHPYLFSSNSNPQDDLDNGGEIYKLELSGSIVGKFGHAGKASGEFGTVNEIDCRNPGQLYVAEVGNYRVQKVSLR